MRLAELPAFMLIWSILAGGITLQDNAYGRLDDWSGLAWLIAKIFIAPIISLVVILIFAIADAWSKE